MQRRIRIILFSTLTYCLSCAFLAINAFVSPVNKIDYLSGSSFPPTIDHLSPSSAIAGSSGFILQIFGSGFAESFSIRISGVDRPTTFVDATQLTTTIDASEIASAGTFTVSVFDPGVEGGESNSLIFTIENPLPSLTTVSPVEATAGEPGFLMTVDGSNFVIGATVAFGSSIYTSTLINSNQLTVQIAAADIAASGLIPITVSNPGPGGGTSNSLNFTINNPVPTVASLIPHSRFAGDTAFSLTVVGTSFIPSSVVYFNGNARPTTFVTTTQLLAQIPGLDLAQLGDFPVTIVNPLPGGGTSTPINFPVLTPPPPTISALTPNHVAAGSPDLVLTVNGTNFFGGSIVRFNGNNRATTFGSNGQLTATITAADLINPGVFPITVLNVGGTISAISNLTVNPVINNVSPVNTRVGGMGFTLTVNGAGFVSGSRIHWAGTAKSTTFVNAGKLTASISATDITTVSKVPITVLNPAPTNLTSNPVEVTVTPSITNLTPLTAVAGDPDFTLTVAGSGFANGASITWNGISRPTTFINSTKLTATILAADITAFSSTPVSVVNPAPLNVPSNALFFNVTGPPPAGECPGLGVSPIANPGLINFGPEKSQLWRNDGIWWGAFSNNIDGIYFYKQTGSTFTQGPLIDSNFVAGTFVAGSPDCLWNGTNLFVLIQESTVLARLYSYTYDSVTQSYTLIPGFPISLPLIGAGTNSSGKFGVISLDQDSTGTLWAAYAGSGVGGDGKVHVMWSTSADHKTWNTAGVTLATGLSTSTQEGAPIIRFGGNKIGVVWSNQVTHELAFSYHTDGSSETLWSAKEVIDVGLGPEGLGSVAENHMSVKASLDGRLFLVAKDNDGNGHLHLYVRGVDGPWGQKTLVVNDFSASPTRPVLLLDNENRSIHIVYKDASANGVSRTFITQSFMDNPAFNAPCPFLDTTQSTQTSSNPTASKQNLDATTDLLVAASTGKKGKTIIFNTVDITPNLVTVSGIAPKEVTAGESADPLGLTVNGKLFVRTPSPGSIVRVNGIDRPTTYNNAGRLTTVIPGSELQSPGMLPIVVVNPDGTTSNERQLLITSVNPSPVITSMSPTREPVGSSEFELTIRGSGFRRTSIVTFNGSNRATTFVSDTQLTATILPSDLLIPGPFPVNVINTSPGGGISPNVRASTFFVQPPCPAVIPQTFEGITVFNNVRSQLWYNDGLWWGALSDNAAGIYFYKQSGGSFIKGPLIVGNFNGRPDVLWDGKNLFMVVFELNTQAKLYKFTYSTATKTYSLLTGFPVLLPLSGVGTGPTPEQVGSITIEQDTTGKLWAAYPATGPGGQGNIRVIWSTSADHKLWNTNGFVLATGVSTTAQEVAPIIRFGPNMIGVAWSNQVAKEIGFRYHIDGELETSWSATEIVDSGFGSELGLGGVADNQMSIKAAPDGRIFMVAKDADDIGYLHLYIRSVSGEWSDPPIPIDPDPHAQNARPTLMLDLGNSDIFIFYENLLAGLSYLNRASMQVPEFGPACPYVSPRSISNITSSKQNVNTSMGLWAAGSTNGSSSEIYLNPLTLTVGAGNPTPTLAGISPNAVAASGNAFTLTLHGTNFIPGSVVYINGLDRPTTFVSDTELRASIFAVDISAVGSFPISVINPRGGTSVSRNLTVNPTILSLYPLSATATGPAFSLTVQGLGFLSGATVRWNGSNRPTTFVNSSQLTAQVSATDLLTAGIFPITVANPGVSGFVTDSKSFIVNNPVPSITAISPTILTTGSAGTTLSVTGSNFVNQSVVRVNGIDCPTTFINNTHLSAQISASHLSSAGELQITVSNPQPGGGSSSTSSLTVNNPTPALAGLIPASLIKGSPPITLTVNGAEFISQSVIEINGAARPTNFVSENELTVLLTATDLQVAGSLNISVFNPSPGGGQSSSLQFFIDNPLPVLTAVAPASATVGSGPLTLSVVGSDFVNGSTVLFNDSPRTTSFINALQLQAELTASDLESTGTFAVTVVNPPPGGGLANVFTFAVNNPLPTIGSLSPFVKATGESGFTLTITGSNFVAGSVVRWNGSERITAFDSSTQLRAEITASDITLPNLASVTVFNPAPGGGLSGESIFTVKSRNVEFESLSGASGSTVTIPIMLDGDGTETGLSLSTAFDPTLLFNPNVALGPDSVGAILNTDMSEIVDGKLGLSLSLPSGQSFEAGKKQILLVTFSLATVTSQTSTAITFSDEPVVREVHDIHSNTLPATFNNGEITISIGYEGDVAPRPNGSNNGTITISDWVQIGRFASGIDIVAPGHELQRADCAPKTTLGNGVVGLSDWVQVGRYASGLDPVVAAGGPTSPTSAPQGAGSIAEGKSVIAGEALAPKSTVRLASTSLGDETREISIELNTLGEENALGFSLMFDATKFSFVSARKGATLEMATLNINDLEAEQGRVGIALALPAGTAFGQGVHQVVVLTFKANTGGNETFLTSFTDQPVAREVVDTKANPMRNLFEQPEIRSSLDFWINETRALLTTEITIHRLHRLHRLRRFQ